MKSLNTALQHIRRSPYQALGAILVMTLTFLISLVFLLIAAGSQSILNWFETRPQVTAFLKEDTKIEQIQALEQKLTQTGKISEMKYVSKEDALALYKEQNKSDPLLLEMVTASILPASLEVSAKDLNMLNDVAKIIKTEPIVEETVFQEDVISTLSSWTNSLRKIGAALISFMSIISLLVIMVIIGMKIALKREEIEILRLIGATSGQIRMPFILEGAIYGLAGAFLAWILTYILLLYSTPFLVTFLAGVPLLPISPLIMFVILGLSELAGSLIGILGSLIAVSRFLKQ